MGRVFSVCSSNVFCMKSGSCQFIKTSSVFLSFHFLKHLIIVLTELLGRFGLLKEHLQIYNRCFSVLRTNILQIKCHALL